DFLIDTPYHWDDESIKYLVKEYQDCIKALEKAIGKKFDYDKLKRIIEVSERGAEYYRKINEFRKLTPYPMHSNEGILMWTAQNFMSGTEDVVALAQSVYNELKNRVEKAEKIVKEERHRILWLFLPILFPSFLFDTLTWLEEKYGAVVVMENTTYSTARIKMDPSTPLESLANKVFLSGFASCYNGPMDNLIDQNLKAAKEYNVDAAICVAHWGCKQSAGTVNMLKKALRENGIPTLILDTCVADERNYPETQIRTRLEEFFEMLKG
ncbi:MAG: 2-hydroxyacyl-CoA dehydratase family protein, partial [Candidatus Heimdallarchaeota archaeon]